MCLLRFRYAVYTYVYHALSLCKYWYIVCLLTSKDAVKVTQHMRFAGASSGGYCTLVSALVAWY